MRNEYYLKNIDYSQPIEKCYSCNSLELTSFRWKNPSLPESFCWHYECNSCGNKLRETEEEVSLFWYNKFIMTKEMIFYWESLGFIFNETKNECRMVTNFARTGNRMITQTVIDKYIKDFQYLFDTDLDIGSMRASGFVDYYSKMHLNGCIQIFKYPEVSYGNS